MTNSHHDQVRHFDSLHRAARPLVLPNAWDAGSARLIEDAGAAAIATTSAGVAWAAVGSRDDGSIGRERAVEVVARVVAAVRVPVTADIEDGYDDLASTVRGVLDAGAVGVNIEDGVQAHPERIAIARRAAGGGLFLNARIDTHLREVGDPATRLKETIDRAAAYVAAGADGIFVPGVTDPETVAMLAKEIQAPLNVMAGPGSPTIDDLAALGVARVSVGPAITLAAYAAIQTAARELLTTGTYAALGTGFAEIDALMGRHSRG
ncbi:2-Methylisocitrate lyase, PEP mutase family [Asanoa hainanensis]|uniref:2-Methylisocitrate lyase, PEP mutase family n=1 Tax=Asanoa hainanensis TaxID=560556 RepID=A0A239LZT2_9ACTN|nr:isocitrate lyase/phosphoenolpyruvate mutase family protein [Asanoa hainanensis]SNT36107.1 2-Methylisocitrate lyase, PEP mutase family [Asanoa hainanensis]